MSRKGGAGLARLARDTRGNTLAMMAAAMIPAAAIAGSAVDTARMYVVKVRLQQACDAGVLAGRKFMTSSNATTLDTAATTQARAFFTNNFRQGWMQTAAVTFEPTKTADQQVAGTASAQVPMTVMRMFSAPAVTLKVACEARFDVADADIMFVLDTTGSMACTASDTNSNCASGSYGSYVRSDKSTGYFVPEVSGSKIQAVRDSVLRFYDTMATNADPTTHIRYGFVPYSGNVNVGRLLPAGTLFTGSYGYASRRLIDEQNSGKVADVTVTDRTSSDCVNVNGRYPGPDKTVRQGWTTDGTAFRLTEAAWTNNKCVAKKQNLRPIWRYETVPYSTADYVAGNAVVDPTKLSGANSDKWRGCIEEAQTTASASFDDANLPYDLDPDHTPDSSNAATMWKPAWPDVIYDRDGPAATNSTANNENWGGDPYYLQRGFAACGAAAARLNTMTRSQVETYLSASGDFRAIGGTYHDVGMIWGTRLIAPAGIFKSDTAPWPGRNAPNRHIIFMTDGAMAPNPDVYGLYGVEREDQRVTGSSLSTQLDRHNARFLAECRAARSRNIEVWVIAFGQALTQQMRDCATQDGNHIFFAADNTALDAAFTKIAKQIAMLRLSK